jgi:triacylglycerol esterase/lipase EstA (alpha/beta hydrolase family)
VFRSWETPQMENDAFVTEDIGLARRSIKGTPGKGRPMASEQFWDAGSSDESRRHMVDSPRNPALLIVFVHGFCGHPSGTWRNLPQWVLERAKLESASVLSFGYPTWPWLKADIATASRELRRLLIEEYSRFGHYIFITHSAGGIVVKEMLRQDLHDACDGDAQERLKLVPQIAYRTRRIFNFAVPHQGAQRLLSAILRFWILVNHAVTLCAAIKSRFGPGEERLGRNA